MATITHDLLERFSESFVSVGDDLGLTRAEVWLILDADFYHFPFNPTDDPGPSLIALFYRNIRAAHFVSTSSHDELLMLVDPQSDDEGDDLGMDGG